MVKIAVCAMMRFFVVSASFAHPALGVTTLALGAISAFWGIAFALLQHDLKRLLAYSTVENIGLIMLGLGGAMVARDQGLGAVAVVCFGGSLFHVLNHGLFKSLLFLGAGAIDCAAGTRDLEKLGGLGARMPFTFACFVLGSAAICGLPPLNGFASEWLLYQAALLFGVHAAAPGTRFLGLLSLGWIALSGAMALACFTKACGVAFLGLPRSEQAAGAREVSRGMRVAQAILALGCVLAGLGAPFLLHVLTPLLATFDGGRASLESFWNLPLLSMTAILCVTAAIAGLWLRAGTVRRYQTWECGFGPLTHRMQVTSSSYVQPIARLFRTLFRYGVHLQIEGSNRRLFPEEIRVEPEASGGLEWTLYRPLLRAFDWLGELIVQLQAGSLHLYLLTMFATLLVMLYVGGRP
jgi:formate hydrogenlyase subunit 3/multisubunit Na+/H+ antiporter MnhD subunit